MANIQNGQQSMKQNITEKQLNELKGKDCSELFYMFSPSKDSPSVSGKKLYEYMLGHVPLLSIGQMIEFLEEKIGKGMGIYGFPADKSLTHPEGGYVIKIVPMEGDTGIFGTMDGYLGKQKPELCDALWSAVKEVLEK